MSYKWLLLTLILAMASCNGSKPAITADDQKKEQPDPKKGGGPGDDDDRPVTMSGSSVDLTVDDAAGLSVVDDDTRFYPYSAAVDAQANEVRYRRKTEVNPGLVNFRRKRGQGLTITITAGPSDNSELEITTTAEEDSNNTRISPPHLNIKSPGGANSRIVEWEKIGKFFLKHPRKGWKVRTIKLSGVAVHSSSGNHGCNLTVSPIVCTVNTTATDIDSRLKVIVCRPLNGSCADTMP